MGKTCVICGKPSGMYPLCREHLQMKAAGKIVKCDECGMWHYADGPCACKGKENSHENNQIDHVKHACIICGTITKNKYLCNNCYKKVDTQTEAIDKNSNAVKLKDYYFNLKNYIYRIQTFDNDTLENQLAKMYAIADIARKLYGYEALYSKVIDDIRDIKEKKAKKQPEALTEDETEKRNQNIPGVHRTKDGHFVKSEYEIKIDDILYDLDIVHAYEYLVTPITERTVVCDWYIPVLRRSGIYIELWGIDSDKKYLINKEEKRKLYKKHELPLIEIEKDELKGDTMGLYNRIEREIRQYKEELKKKL